MALGDGYVDKQEVKARVGITDEADDVFIAEACKAASRHVEKICRRQFNNAGVVTARTFDALSWWVAHVDDFHTVTGLIIKTDDDDDGVFETTWTTADYELRPLNGTRDGTTGWPFWAIHAVQAKRLPNTQRAPLQVTANWGWATVPPPVKEATLILAEEIWKLKDAPFGVAGFGEFGAVRVRENPKVSALLSSYRRAAVRVR